MSDVTCKVASPMSLRSPLEAHKYTSETGCPWTKRIIGKEKEVMAHGKEECRVMRVREETMCLFFGARSRAMRSSR